MLVLSLSKHRAAALEKEPTISTTTSLEYVESYVGEDDHLAAGRRRAEEVGVSPIGAAGGAALKFLASIIDAKAVAEIGTGTGVSGLWLLRGMAPDGILTSVDLEAEHQRLARETFTEAGIPPQRFRLITGSALDVMTRLTDNGYDMVFVDADKVEYGEYLDQALRLVRTGGLIVFDNALWHGRVADSSQRDPDTLAIRELLNRVANDEQLRSVLLGVGDGLLAAQLVE